MRIGCVQKEILAFLANNNSKCLVKNLHKLLKPRSKEAINIILERMVASNLLFREGFWVYTNPVKMEDCDNIFDWRRDVDDESPAKLWIWPETVFPCFVSYAPSEYGDFSLVNSVGYDDFNTVDCNLNLWG